MQTVQKYRAVGQGLSPGQILETLLRGVSRAGSTAGAVDVDVDVFTHALYVTLPATEDRESSSQLELVGLVSIKRN